MIMLLLLLVIVPSVQASDVHLYENRPYATEEVENLSRFELCLLRNEIYALHGYVFSTEWLAEYFASQNWYLPDPDFTAPAEFDPGLSEEELKNILLFREAGADLEQTLHGCWFPDRLEDLDVNYYRDLSSVVDLPPPPDWYGWFTSIQPELGAYPDYSEEDLLPYSVFDDLYTFCGMHETDEQWQQTVVLLDDYGVQDRSVFRVFFRPDRTIAIVEKVTLMFLCALGYDPYVVWTVWYAPDSEFVIFEPDCKLEWATKDLILAYTCSSDECVLRAALRGVHPTITLEIYDEPYGNLPLSIEINNEEIGGYDRYEALFWNRTDW